jgi:cbb3-type cytochrome oxidase subunit 3
MHKMFAGLAGDTQTSKDDKKAQSKGHTGRTVLIVLLGIGAVVLLSFFLFKYWQKKKREEQHARLLKLFEEDDDIEVELGLRD